MRKAFNIAMAALVAWILWQSYCAGSPGDAAEYPQAVASSAMVEGLSHMKTCQSYFSRPISVTHDRLRDVLYVSCLDDSDDIDDNGRGLICRADIFGEIIDTLIAQQLNQPKGAKAAGGFLYIADVSRVLRISLQSDSLDCIYALPRAKYLCDVEADGRGNVFVSDSHEGCVYKIAGDSVSVFCRDSILCNVAGLCLDGKTLVAGAKNCIVRIDEKGCPQIFQKTPFSVYGIKSDDAGRYIASDFVGNIYSVSKQGTRIIYKGKANSADFEYIPEQRMIYLPNYKENSLVLFQVCDSILNQ